MSAPWLHFLLSRRYAVTATGDPVPAASVPPVPTQEARGTLTAQNEPLDEALPENALPLASAQNNSNGPFLILPNNISLIDPLLVYAHFAALKPLVLLHKTQGRSLQMLAGHVDIAIIPDDAAHSADSPQADEATDELSACSYACAEATPDNPSTPAVQVMDAQTARIKTGTPQPSGALERAADALASGRSVLLWPCPQLQRYSLQEHNAQGQTCQNNTYRGVTENTPAFALLHLLQQRGQNLPELFLVRSEGLWGSRFSCYHTGQRTPTFFSTLCTRLPALLLGPFLKRRPVRIVTRRHRPGSKPLQPNAFKNMLSTWFDAGDNSAVLVPLLIFGRIRRMPLEHSVSSLPAVSPTAPPLAPPVTPTAAPHAVPETHTAPASAATDTAAFAVQPPHAAPLTEPLPGNSDDAPLSAPPPLSSSVHGTAAESATGAVKPTINAPLADIAPAVPRTPPLLPVQHALTRQGSVTDASYSQHFSRRSLLGLAKAIGALIGPVPATRIGVALPCGVGAMAAYVAILDCTLENDRTPVLLDPAMSTEQLTACAKETGISHVITARQLHGLGLPPGTTPMYLEDITSAQMMRGSALSFMGFAGTTELEAPAAIFCQAGSALPLSLSHHELMTSLHSLIEHLAVPPLNAHSLSILGCLPLHTPLGLLVNTILPLSCGVPIVTVSDPHDAITLAHSAEDYSVNCFTGSPQSLRNLLRQARSQLAFRYILLTTDPCPEDLLALIPKACPHAQVFTADMFGDIEIMHVGGKDTF